MKAPDYVWRGWDGEDFTANLANGEACMPLANIGHMDISLSYNTELAKWILVDTLGGPNFPNYGVYYSLSDDLINWQAPTQLLAAPHPVNNGIAYPSIVDPDEFEQNYYHSDNQFYLYYVKFNNGQGGLNRDIERVSITLQNDS